VLTFIISLLLAYLLKLLNSVLRVFVRSTENKLIQAGQV